jgi:hypothetical protein
MPSLPSETSRHACVVPNHQLVLNLPQVVSRYVAGFDCLPEVGGFAFGVSELLHFKWEVFFAVECVRVRTLYRQQIQNAMSWGAWLCTHNIPMYSRHGSGDILPRLSRHC